MFVDVCKQFFKNNCTNLPATNRLTGSRAQADEEVSQVGDCRQAVDVTVDVFGNVVVDAVKGCAVGEPGRSERGVEDLLADLVEVRRVLVSEIARLNGLGDVNVNGVQRCSTLSRRSDEVGFDVFGHLQLKSFGHVCLEILELLAKSYDLFGWVNLFTTTATNDDDNFFHLKTPFRFFIGQPSATWRR